MPALPFTVEALKRLALPAKGFTDYSDTPTRGLSLRVGTTTKVFSLRYRLPGGGKLERVTLGRFPEMSLSEARAKCDHLRGEVRKGVSPQRVRQDAATAPTFKTRAEAYLANPNKKLAARSLDEKRRALMLYAKPLHGLSLAAVTKARLIALIDRVTIAHGPVQANRVSAHLSAFFTWAVRRGEIAETPARLLPKNPETARARVLTDDELRALWTATADGEGHDRLVRLILLTGVRRGEAGGLRWSEFDPTTATWTVPADRMKRGGAHEVPLSGLALAQLPPRRDGMDSVFGKRDGPFSGWSKCKDRLDGGCRSRRGACTIFGARSRRACTRPASSRTSSRRSSATSAATGRASPAATTGRPIAGRSGRRSSGGRTSSRRSSA